MSHAPYTAQNPSPRETPEQLRARVPGWGFDLDPHDRPSWPKLSPREDLTGAHWDVPDQQPELRPRERSIEHAHLTPVFGTAQPTKGLSGVIRRYSYARFSEGRNAHWLLLVAADRVDAVESHLASLVTTRPDNPLTQTGIRAEVSGGGLSSRRGRTDVRHQVLDPLLVAGPWVSVAGVGALAARKVRRRLA